MNYSVMYLYHMFLLHTFPSQYKYKKCETSSVQDILMTLPFTPNMGLCHSIMRATISSSIVFILILSNH